MLSGGSNYTFTESISILKKSERNWFKRNIANIGHRPQLS